MYSKPNYPLFFLSNHGMGWCLYLARAFWNQTCTTRLLSPEMSAILQKIGMKSYFFLIFFFVFNWMKNWTFLGLDRLGCSQVGNLPGNKHSDVPSVVSFFCFFISLLFVCWKFAWKQTFRCILCCFFFSGLFHFFVGILMGKKHSDASSVIFCVVF